MKKATTFIAHGSSKSEANQFIQKLILDTKSQNTNLGFLELASPNINQAIEKHIKNGFEVIEIIPLFLVPGKHVKQDIPQIILDLQKQHPSVSLNLQSFLGERPELLELLKKL